MVKSYNVIFKVRIGSIIEFLKYRNVTNVNSLIAYVERKGKEVLFVNLYDSKSKQPILQEVHEKGKKYY